MLDTMDAIKECRKHITFTVEGEEFTTYSLKRPVPRTELESLRGRISAKHGGKKITFLNEVHNTFPL
jgi:hypothetical protein